MDVVSAACISAVIRCVCMCVCVCVCAGPPVWFSTATLAAAFWGSVCVFGVRVVPVLRTSWAFRDCACVSVCVCLCVVRVHLFVRRDGESSTRILLLQSEAHCFDWADKLARSPQSAIFPPRLHSLTLLHPLTPSPPQALPPLLLPLFLPLSLCAKDSRSRRQ